MSESDCLSRFLQMKRITFPKEEIEKRTSISTQIHLCRQAPVSVLFSRVRYPDDVLLT